jgi:solute carrier family 25 carnitine/acylcarnitine transporter 20/29
MGFFVLSGLVSWWVVMPFDVIKSKMQADNPHKPVYKNMLHCAALTVNEYGARGLYQGFWSASLRAFPVNATAFLAFEFIHDQCAIIRPTKIQD